MIIISLAIPIVMMGMVGGMLSQNIAGGLSFNYERYMMMGMMVIMLFMTATMGMLTLVGRIEYRLNLYSTALYI